MESLYPIVGLSSEQSWCWLHIIHIEALRHLLYVVGLGEPECLRRPISLYPHAQNVSGLSEFLHCEFIVNAPFQLSDLCLIAPDCNKHVVDI